MTIEIVDRLEAVEIDDTHSQPAIAAARATERLFQHLEEAAAIGEQSEAV